MLPCPTVVCSQLHGLMKMKCLFHHRNIFHPCQNSDKYCSNKQKKRLQSLTVDGFSALLPFVLVTD
jgi:hypothetical protein